MPNQPHPNFDLPRCVTHEQVETVFRHNRPDVALLWVQTVIGEAVQVSVNHLGPEAVMPFLFALYHECESATIPPDIRALLRPKPPLTRRERFARWWASKSETFYFGLMAGLAIGGLLQLWAASV